jgi:hypothetical protein
MLYNKKDFPRFVETAGKITILTSLIGVAVFLVAFIFDVGTMHINSARAANTASTTLTVLNTPPTFTVNAHEKVESSTSSPTNSGTQIRWRALGTDSNGAPYFLLVCSTNASPTAHAAAGIGSLGTVAPTCGAGATTWAVSTGTPSGTYSDIGTTTTEAFAEKNVWYAWVCDDDPFNPRCNNVPVQGYSATNSSPFHVNHRPTFTTFSNNGPKDPGQAITFSSVSTDPDTVGGRDKIYLVVCDNNGGINPITRTCTTGGIASSTSIANDNATSSYTLASIIRDNTYAGYGYIVDEHGHAATANPRNQNFVVNNVAPRLLNSDITLNNGGDIYLTAPANETTGFHLDFTVRDANSCKNAANGSEITGYRVAIHRSGIATSTCTGLAGSYNPNNCYASGVSGTVWNLSCTASTTSCTGPTDDTQVYNCTFPLWFVADPTDSGTVVSPYAAENWVASVMATDDNSANSSMVNGNGPVDIISFTALDLITNSIPYGALEPGNNNANLSATTTIRSVGNTGLDELLVGDSMCTTYSTSNKCKPYATSTIPESKQKFSTTSLSYSSSFATTLSSTTNKELEINIHKTTSTTTYQSGVTYWGIGVPVAITLAGSYKGLNTFIAKTAETIDW